MIELRFTNDGLHLTVTKIFAALEYVGEIRIRSHEMISTHFDFLKDSIMEHVPQCSTMMNHYGKKNLICLLLHNCHLLLQDRNCLLL